MNISSTTRRRLGFFLFAVGFISGVLLLGGIAWANLEASMFGSGDVGENLSSLRCSLLVTPDETAWAQVTLHNPLDRPITRFVRWRIAQRHILLADEERDVVELAPGEKKRVRRSLSPASGVYGGRVLMVSAYVGGVHPLPPLEGSCGVWALHIPWLTGDAILILANLIALAGMGLGLWLVRRNPSGPEGVSGGAFAMLLFLFVTGMGLVLLFRWWALGGAAALLMILLMGLWLLYRLDKTWSRVEPPV
jgi:hypothetical protein